MGKETKRLSKGFWHSFILITHRSNYVKMEAYNV